MKRKKNEKGPDSARKTPCFWKFPARAGRREGRGAVDIKCGLRRGSKSLWLLWSGGGEGRELGEAAL